jgi:hypothetical protein
MKMILEYDCEEESDDARTALDGYKWKMAMWDLDQLLRTATKYGSFELRDATPEEVDMADKIREFIREILNEHNLNLD